MSQFGLKRETFFEGILQRTHPEYNVKLPIFYYDNTSMTALYTASTAKMRAHLPSDALHPVEVYPADAWQPFPPLNTGRPTSARIMNFHLRPWLLTGRKACRAWPWQVGCCAMNCISVFYPCRWIQKSRERAGLKWPAIRNS